MFVPEDAVFECSRCERSQAQESIHRMTTEKGSLFTASQTSLQTDSSGLVVPTQRGSYDIRMRHTCNSAQDMVAESLLHLP